MKFLDTEISPLGPGCWPIGGAMFSATGETLGYVNTNLTKPINKTTLLAILDSYLTNPLTTGSERKAG